MKRSVHEIILSRMILSGNSKQVGYAQAAEAARLSWYTLFKKTKESIVRRWADVSKGVLEYPSTAENILGVYTVNHCGDVSPLYEDNFKNLIPPPTKCTCTNCDHMDCMCPTVGDNISSIDIEIEGEVYTNKINSRVLKNGEVVEEKYEWVAAYDNNGTFLEAKLVESQTTKCKVDVKACGCVIDSEENSEKLTKCGCVNDYCAPYLRHRYPSVYNKFGYYKKDDVNRKIHLFDCHGKKSKLKQAIVVYQSNGADMLVPEYAEQALIALLDWTAKQYSPMYNYNDRIEAKRYYARMKNQMIRYLNPINFEVVVHGDNAITFSQAHGNRNWWGMNGENNSHSGNNFPTIVQQAPVTQITNTTIIQQGSKYASLTAKVDGNTGSPVAGQNTWQNNSLIGATELEIIFVNKNPETEIDGDFSLNSTTGTITRNNVWFTGDTLVIQTFKLA